MSEYQAVLRQPTDGRMPVIGCHLSSAKGYAAMAKTAASIDANTFAFFTRNPRGGKAKAIDDADVKAFAEEAALAGIGRIVAHGSYTVNPCAAKEQVRSFAFQALAEDLARMERTPGQLLNIHPGSHVGQGADVGIEFIAEVLNTVLTPEQTTTLLLETMAGKGSEVGRTFPELAAIVLSSTAIWGFALIPAMYGMRDTTLRMTWMVCSRNSTVLSGWIGCVLCTLTIPSTNAVPIKIAMRALAKAALAKKRWLP